MFRKEISDGDLMLTHKPWYSVTYTPYRNLSEEVRCLRDLKGEAESKYKKLTEQHRVAAINVADELETLQVLLWENSKAYFEVDVDNSILDMREGMRYAYNRKPKQKQGASSNNGNQQKQRQSQQRKRGQGRKESLLSLFARSEVTVH